MELEEECAEPAGLPGGSPAAGIILVVNPIWVGGSLADPLPSTAP